jgi:hypothetical protein
VRSSTVEAIPTLSYGIEVSYYSLIVCATAAEISILLKKEKIFAYGESRKDFNDAVRFLVEHYPKVGFTKCKVKRVVNLFEDTGSVRELNYLAKISRSCFSPLWKN